jgi:hypothetical protein
VKTTVTKQIFHQVIDYFKSFTDVLQPTTGKHLFIYNAPKVDRLNEYFHSYTHLGEYQLFDHDTFYELPMTITGINNSFHLRRDYVVFERDAMGYLSYNYENESNLDISSLELFYSNIYAEVSQYLSQKIDESHQITSRDDYHESRNLKSVSAIELFDM